MLPEHIWYEILSNIPLFTSLTINKWLRRIMIEYHSTNKMLCWRSQYLAIWSEPVYEPTSWIWLYIYAKQHLCTCCGAKGSFHKKWNVYLCNRCENIDKYKTISMDMAQKIYYLNQVEYSSLIKNGMVRWVDAKQLGETKYYKYIHSRTSRLNEPYFGMSLNRNQYIQYGIKRKISEIEFEDSEIDDFIDTENIDEIDLEQLMLNY